MSQRSWPNALICATLLFGIAVGCRPAPDNQRPSNPNSNASSTSQIGENLQDARRAFQLGRFQESLRISQALLKDAPESVGPLMLAGESATKLTQFRDAIDFYRRVPDTAGKDAATARWAEGEIHYHLGQPTRCIEALQSSLRINPNLVEARERLVWMLGVCGRRRELQPHLMALLKANRTSVEILLDLGNPWTENQDWKEIDRYRKAAPDDLLPNLVYAKRHQSLGELDRAEEFLVTLLKQQPKLLAAHVQLGELYLVSDFRKLTKWNSELPEGAEQNTDVWNIRGLWLEKAGDVSGAIHCLIQSISLDPNHFLAEASLARLLNQVGETDRVEELTERSLKIQQLNQTIERIGSKNNYEPTIRQAAELTFDLGRYWESIGWSQYGKALNPSATWHTELMQRVLATGTVNPAMPQCVVNASALVSDVWRERFPMPQFPRIETIDTRQSTSAQSSSAQALTAQTTELSSGLRFSNIAKQAGVDFVFRNSTVDRTAGRRMFEFTGGGIGILDYDCDGRPICF